MPQHAGGWCKVWTDYKSGVKKKLTKNKQLLTRTGGGPYKEIPLTETEEDVSVLVTLNTTVHGIAKINNFGASRTPLPKRVEGSNLSEIYLPLEQNTLTQEMDLSIEENVTSLETVNEEANTQNSSFTNLKPRQLKRNRKEEKPELLKEQIKIQKKLASDVTSALEKMKEQNKENYNVIKYVMLYNKKQTKIFELQLEEQKRHNEEMKILLMKKLL
ncbi:uncharacterized protein LOC135950996 [Calliphora vicina]|uniref:uncharacterized protein LOC135950996 n=1 Tax=Calliphora vicina TaxID=7373 RepID=UPI00325BB563